MIRKHKKEIISYIILVLVVLAFQLYVWNMLRVKRLEEMPVELSVIMRGQSSEGMDNIRRGIELAALDYNIDVTFITLSQENNVEEQKELIEREVGLNAQAILLSAADSQLLCSAVAKAEQKIPVICFESGLTCDDHAGYISADNYQMGEELGKLLLTSGIDRGNILVIGGGVNCQSIQERREGVLHTLEDTDITVSEQTSVQAGTELAGYDAVLALDAYHLESAACYLADENRDIPLLGIGATNKIAYYMERGVIYGIIAQNEVEMGYIGAKQSAEAVRSGKQDILPEVEFRVITEETMFEKENERLLFPFGN